MFYVDKNITFRQFHIGDLVYLKLHPFGQSSITHRPYAKLLFRYFGPFRIIERYVSTAYIPLLLETIDIHLVCLMSQLKLHILDHTPVFYDIPPTTFSEYTPLVPE
jgi:hypothetical protein